MISRRQQDRQRKNDSWTEGQTDRRTDRSPVTDCLAQMDKQADKDIYLTYTRYICKVYRKRKCKTKAQNTFKNYY